MAVCPVNPSLDVTVARDDDNDDGGALHHAFLILCFESSNAPLKRALCAPHECTIATGLDGSNNLARYRDRHGQLVCVIEIKANKQEKLQGWLEVSQFLEPYGFHYETVCLTLRSHERNRREVCFAVQTRNSMSDDDMRTRFVR